jgi:hypothetical protein
MGAVHYTKTALLIYLPPSRTAHYDKGPDKPGSHCPLVSTVRQASELGRQQDEKSIGFIVNSWRLYSIYTVSRGDGGRCTERRRSADKSSDREQRAKSAVEQPLEPEPKLPFLLSRIQPLLQPQPCRSTDAILPERLHDHLSLPRATSILGGAHSHRQIKCGNFCFPHFLSILLPRRSRAIRLCGVERET